MSTRTTPQSCGGLVARLRSWPIWELPHWLASLVTGVVAAYVCAVVAAATQTSFSLHDLALFVLLLGFMAASIELTRRAGDPAGLSMDVYGVWQLPIAIFLPPVFALIAPISKLALTQWRTRQTVLYRRIFTTSAQGLAYGAASAIFHVARNHVPFVTAGPGYHWLIWVAAAAMCALIRWTINATLVLTAVKGSDQGVSIRQMQFGKEPLYNDLAELCIGLAATVLIAVNWFLVALFLPAVTLLQRSLRHAQLENASRVDAKTGLLNAATWQREASIELSRATRTRTPLAVAMIDIDHFKQVNDTYGHLAGDAVLATLSATLRALLREYDIIGRFGGEEFAILLPQTDMVKAEQITERLRAKLAEITVTTGTGAGAEAPLQVTVSIGVATLQATRRDLDELIAAADAALYRAKAQGRNQVCLSAENVV
ncbi:MAG TPA: GGDEF domain-containing protein [Streptosporangiaceae bacterium]|jgi:diguanylate cyclase (GGDEF)-like protein